MISSGRRRRRGRNTILILLVLILLCAGIGLYAVRLFVAPDRQGLATARATQESVEREQAARVAEIDTVRKNLRPEAASVRDWTLQKTAATCARLENSDLKLLGQLEHYYLLRSEPNILDQIRAHVEAAVSSNSATPFESEMSQYVNSEDDLLKCAYRYVDAFTPLREAEQALELGVFAVSASESELRGIPIRLAAMVSLRGLGELRAGEPRRALASAQHCYDFMREGWEPHNYYPTLGDSWQPYNYYSNDPRDYADRLIEQIADAAWPDSPFTPEERERCLAGIGWRPTPEQQRETLFIWASKDPNAYYGPDRPIAETYDLLKRVISPLRNAGIYQRAHELAPLLGKRAFEVSAQTNAIEDRIPSYAPFTYVVISQAIRFNNGSAYRSLQADIARVAFALKDYHREHGAYPPTLEGMTPNAIPALPLSPITGAPCEYQSDGKTFTLVRRSKRGDYTETLWTATK